MFKCRAEFSLLSRPRDSPGPPLRPEAREGICTFTQRFHHILRVASYNENEGEKAETEHAAKSAKAELTLWKRSFPPPQSFLRAWQLMLK